MPYIEAKAGRGAMVIYREIPMRHHVMPWIDLLPNVNPSFVTQRNLVAIKIALADDYMRRAERLRQEAYFDSMRLECRAMAACGLEAVERAKRMAE